MIKVHRRAHIENTTPEAIFAALSDPNSITMILPRVQKVELLSRDEVARKARLVTYMSLGGIFGTIRCEGDLTWTDNQEIVFNVRTPVPVETRWELVPAINGTEIKTTMGLNLAPMLGPMAAFVPTQQVADMLIAELDAALKSIKKQMHETELNMQAVAA
ncbi:SRPBCC family protein [Candidatus Chloroploca asiatica]|uniref:Cyclase n=1 Tax=Candidatus Chloroploca asiatica TaxID=1506545 RepID=A0A2H3KR96_9CHLR|nr:SRPBCC family protein [Candidatus Chloroploca asiatica]PDW01069.1 cyclase [Candidatus Chloroploca asiatica]